MARKPSRLKRNIPLTLERKRVWDHIGKDTVDGLGVSIDIERLKRQRVEDEKVESLENDQNEGFSADDDRDSMIDSASEISQEDSAEATPQLSPPKTIVVQTSSPARSTANLDLDSVPDALMSRLTSKFASLFDHETPRMPRILITTSINSTIHKEAHLLTTLFPHSIYVPRSAHKFEHKWSIQEISSFAANRNYTAVIVLNEDQKKPKGLDIIHLPDGPMFHLSLTNWVEGKKLPGHGTATNHYPELILNNFRTPLGLLTAHLFRNLFPSRPEFTGRQVVTGTWTLDKLNIWADGLLV